MTTPRLMTGTEAAEYCNVALGTFSKWVADGRMPSPLPGTRRWDRRAIDAALDKLSGIAPSIVPAEDPFDQWKQENEARKAAARTRDRV